MVVDAALLFCIVFFGYNCIENDIMLTNLPQLWNNYRLGSVKNTCLLILSVGVLIGWITYNRAGRVMSFLEDIRDYRCTLLLVLLYLFFMC